MLLPNELRRSTVATDVGTPVGLGSSNCRALRASDDLLVSDLSFLPAGRKSATWIFCATSYSLSIEKRWRLVKLNRRSFPQGSLDAARRLRDLGEESLVAPIPGRTGTRWSRIDDAHTLAVFPCVETGESVEAPVERFDPSACRIATW